MSDRSEQPAGGVWQPVAEPVSSPVVGCVYERWQSGSRRGERQDGRIIALAVEGGGMRAVISAGMCTVLEAVGLTDAFDVIYGTSSGALNGSYTATGQAAEGASNYNDSATRRFTNAARMLIGRPAVDFGYLFDEIISKKRPYREEGFATGPEFRTLAVEQESKSLEMLHDFWSVDELTLAVRASCSIPVLSRPSTYHGKRYLDGGLLAPVPHKLALEHGATDVLALRTRPAGFRKGSESRLGIRLARRQDPELATLIADQAGVYDRMAADLQQRSEEGDEHVYQIAPPDDVVEISRTEHSLAKVRAGLQAGAAAVTEAFGLPKPQLLWDEQAERYKLVPQITPRT